MRYTVIYKQSLQRPRFKDIESDSFDELSVDDAKAFFGVDVPFVYGVIDWDAERVIPAAIAFGGRIIEVPDGDFGELTPAEYFEQIAEARDAAAMKTQQDTEQ